MVRRLHVLLLVMILAVVSVVPASGQASAAGAPVVGSYSRVAGSIAYLNMRTGPGYGYSVRTTMRKGEIVKILAGRYNGEWYKVSYRGFVGYALDDYLVHTGLAGASIARSYYKVVVVSLARQQAEVYQNGQLVFVSAVTTGRPGYTTPTGTFKVMAKLSPHRFVSPYPKGSSGYYEPFTAEYAIRFRTGGYYFHDIYRRPYYGYGTNVVHTDPDGVVRKGSIGCVNMPLWSVSKLYSWISVGTVVRVVSW